MKRILVPCDFSRQAINAFRFAIDIAGKEGKIHLLNVFELPVLQNSRLMPVFTYEEAMLKELRTKVTSRFQKLINQYAAKNVQIKFSADMGTVPAMILDYAEKNKIDLIAMGTKGSAGWEKVLIGSNTEKIVRHAAIPVMTVKKYPPRGSIRDIVFPTSLEEGQDKVVKRVIDLQQVFKARLHILRVNTPAAFSSDIVTRQRMKDFVKRFSLKNITVNIFNDENEEAGIANFAMLARADMIAMGTHGRRGFAHLFTGSITEDMVNAADYPIWTCNLREV